MEPSQKRPNQKKIACLFAVSCLLSSSSAVRADVTMAGSITVPISIAGISNPACDDFAIGVYNPPKCSPGRLCSNLGSEIRSATASGKYSSGKCSYSVAVPENKKFLVSVDLTKHTPKCAGIAGTVLLAGLSGQTSLEFSGVPSSAVVGINFKLTAACQGPAK